MEKRSVGVAVISDLHLGTYGCRAHELVTYLKSITPQLLILNGDVIDIWQFSKHYFPPTQVSVIKEIMNLMAGGTRVIYVTGNHDEALRKYADIQIGQLQLVDKLVIEIDHKMTWIFHGDVFDNTTHGSAKFWAKLGSNGYAMLIAFNRCINWCLNLLGKDRVSFSKNVMKKVNQAIVKIDQFETLVGDLAIAKKYDYVLCGHIHQPQKRVITNKHGSVVYLNSGDWVEHMTALEYYDQDWHIYTYDEEKMKTVKVKTMLKKVADVMTDEISFHMHSLGA
jgi:UDP-2,3-diacylglucosamine pyrophosphatase LpxH